MTYHQNQAAAIAQNLMGKFDRKLCLGIHLPKLQPRPLVSAYAPQSQQQQRIQLRQPSVFICLDDPRSGLTVQVRNRSPEHEKNRNVAFLADNLTTGPINSISYNKDMTEEAKVENAAPQPWTNIHPPWTTKLRPLSDIRELTEPSLIDSATQRGLSRNPSLKREGSLSRKDSNKSTQNGIPRKSSQGSKQGDRAKGVAQRIANIDHSKSGHILPESQTDQSSTYSFSLENVNAPQRSPNRSRADLREKSHAQLRQNHTPKRIHPLAYTVPNNGISNSPCRELVQDIGRMRLDMDQYSRSRTLIRTHDPNIDILEFPTHRHPRMTVELHLGATLFVGGGSIEGHVRIVVDDVERARHKRQLAISRVSIDLLGVEEIAGPRRSAFLNLTTELIDSDNPPPHNMVESLKQISPIDPFWHLAASICNLPFLLSLPLDVGPPPFTSRQAKIRYVLGATLLIRDSGKQYLIRTSQDVSVISVYDPEKALMSLPSPLTVSDEYCRHRDGPSESVRVTAGLHRQVWVSGTNIFVDIRIANSLKKGVKRLELQLERDILCYKHAAASTLEKSATQSRVFDFNERTILTKNVLKARSTTGWTGVPSQSTDLRTFDLELPRGQGTVKCGKFFEVRYFLNIIVGTSSKPKLMVVQLPIVLIHMNSLDVVPNSVAQVAAAIEEKRARSRHQRNGSKRSMHKRGGSSASRVQGRAFAAPRKQSQDRLVAEELLEFAGPATLLNSSPASMYKASPRRAIHHPIRLNASGRSPQSPFTRAPKLPPPTQSGNPAKIYNSQAPPPPPRFRIPIRRSRSRDLDEDFSYRTPPNTGPSNQSRKPEARPPPQVQSRATTIEEARARLRSMRSNDSMLQHPLPPAPAPPVMPPKDGGLRELGIAAGPPASIPTNIGEPTSVADAGSGNALGKALPFRRMNTIDRWKVGGSGWFADRGRERDEMREREKEKERERERDREGRGFGVWI